MYTGEHIPYAKRTRLLRKVTHEDHAYVHSLSFMGLSIRRICIHLGDRFGLGKPLSRLNLYNHFRYDLVKRQRGRRAGASLLKQRMMNNFSGEMQRMIDESKARARSARSKHGQD